MERDKNKRLHYAPIQGTTALDYLNADLRKDMSTVIYHRPLPDGESELLLRSDAALHAAIDVESGLRWLAKTALLIPRSWRNLVYDWVAKNRHLFFKGESCKLSQADNLGRILP